MRVSASARQPSSITPTLLRHRPRGARSRLSRQSAVFFSCLLLTAPGCSEAIGPLLGPADLCGAQGNAVAAFADAALASAVRGALGLDTGDALTCQRVASLQSLDANAAGITSLAGAQNLTGLSELLLAANSISEVSHLSGLTGLKLLDLRENAITDASALSGLSGLVGLSLSRNAITDIGPLSGLTGLQLLGLDHNTITDIGPLAGLLTLFRLVLYNNSITDLSPLSGLTALNLLDLGRNSVPDLSPLRGLTDLTVLGLEGASITDIAPLAGLTLVITLVLDDNMDLVDIQPLIDNPGIGSGDTVQLDDTSVSCASIATLVARGVSVVSRCS